MTKAKTHPAPKHLSVESQALWRSIIASHVLDDDASRELLRQFCETVDRIRGLQRRIKVDGLMVPGSAGQLRPHPLLNIESDTRRTLLALVRGLRLDIATENF